LRTYLKKGRSSSKRNRPAKTGYIYPDLAANKDGTTSRKRGPYFKVKRPDRKLLSILSRVPPNQEERKDRRKLRLVYYCILPILFVRLHYLPDYVRVRELEKYYYNALNTLRCSSGGTGKVNRLSRALRYYPFREDTPLSE